MKTQVFDPYAEDDFRTPTNQIEFETETSRRYSGRSTYSARGGEELYTRDIEGYLSPGHTPRDSTYASSITSTVVGTAEDEKKTGESYGVKGI